jgi:hypothetical protein
MNTHPTPKQVARSINNQKAKIARIDARIGALMSQRVTEEEKLADLWNKQVLTRNPVVTGGGQPFQGSQLVVIEKRTPDGKLDFSLPQPSADPMTFDGLYALFFREDKDAPGSWDALRAWLDSKGWIVRAKTW